MGRYRGRKEAQFSGEWRAREIEGSGAEQEIKWRVESMRDTGEWWRAKRHQGEWRRARKRGGE